MNKKSKVLIRLIKWKWARFKDFKKKEFWQEGYEITDYSHMPFLPDEYYNS